MVSRFFSDISRFEDYKDYYLKESQEALILELDVPGFSEEDLNISIDGREMRIQGERKTGGPVKMKRTFTLGRNVDHEKIDAEVKNGLLTVTLPKAESRKIMVRGSRL
jgi:HSP20 family protein